jgi:hypothetical protein
LSVSLPSRASLGTDPSGGRRAGYLLAAAPCHSLARSGTNDRPSSLAAAAATTTIPVVFLTGRDPVGQGLAASFSRPDRNLTGINVFTIELGQKRLELLREMVPNAATFAWISRNRRLARDFERYPATVTAFVRLAMIRIMLRRLATNASS